MDLMESGVLSRPELPDNMELYASYAEMAIANGVSPDLPSPHVAAASRLPDDFLPCAPGSATGRTRPDIGCPQRRQGLRRGMKARGVSSPDRAYGALMASYEPEDLFGHRRMGLIN
ncbi:hypothetical protein [Kitasatospora sp. NPDC056184]|uniref:hypothetical protein n=1 Tax=Kitasatospora sp. NPDC056184 TaxID=3345738 RepID=UPI0035D5F0A1